jgi:hypothetical protein
MATNDVDDRTALRYARNYGFGQSTSLKQRPRFRAGVPEARRTMVASGALMVLSFLRFVGFGRKRRGVTPDVSA